MNVPEPEAKQCLQKVKERQMGYLFENMEKIDIQQERKKVAQMRKESEQMRKESEQMRKESEQMRKEHKELETKLEHTEQKLTNTRSELEITHKELENTQQKALQTLIDTVISFCQNYGVTRETACKELMERCNLTADEANAQLLLHWKDSPNT